MSKPDSENSVEVAFYLIGPSVDPDDLTNVFGVFPCVSVRKGDENRRKSTGELIGHRREGSWGFSSSDKVNSNNPDDHFSYITSIISDKMGYILSLNPDISPFFEITFLLSTSRLSTSCVLTQELVNVSQKIGAELGFVARCNQRA
jgi:hypothetical protein